MAKSSKANDPYGPTNVGSGTHYLTRYFALVLLAFGCVSMLMNAHHEVHTIPGNSGSHLENLRRDSWSLSSQKEQKKTEKFLEKKKDKEEPKDDHNVANREPKFHKLAGLNCDDHGGPSEDIAKEMVFWEDIPSDEKYVSPFKKKGQTQYLTFEPDGGGWNNIRMAMETVLALAVAMGRTLVLPPEQGMYLLHKGEGNQRKHFSFAHFFHMESISEEHLGVEVITMKEFLQREAMTGRMVNTETGQVTFPPGNRTDWDGDSTGAVKSKLNKWLRQSTHMTIWNPEECLAAFPANTGPEDIEKLKNIKKEVETKDGGFKSYEAYVGKPFAVDASPKDRMQEMWAGRSELCIYDEVMQNAPVIHLPHDHEMEGARLLVHFYAFLFFEDWKQDLWMKRLIRDHMRYIDEIQCAAARVVHALRERAKKNDPTKNAKGEFDAFHIRRGDFQYKVTRFDAPKIYDMSKDELTEGSTVYVATDERDKSFFKPLADKYDVVFLDDFKEAIGDLNTNYYGMLDSLIASKGRIFFGCWFSTFTGYINRIRGYRSVNEKQPGYEDGLLPTSYYYALEDRKLHLHTYYPVKKSFYAREFPTSWRSIDKGIGEL